MKKTYYDIKTDLCAFPDAWCYLVWSKRGPGKTYSTLRYMVEHEKQFVFLKRTIEDVKLLCASGTRHGVEFDVSPFIPLNRDFGWDIRPVYIIKGIAGFYKYENDQAVGKPIGYCTALSAAKDIKGFDMSEADFLVFDEFIPKKHERINRKEGEALLDIYMTIRRDLLLRGRDELKLICLANATSINNPVFDTLNVVDAAARMEVYKQEYNYIQDRKILLHALPSDRYVQEEEKSGIELAMTGTEWAEMAFGGKFAYDDFSSVRHQRMKGYAPVCSYEYKKKMVYIYQKDGYYYATKAKGKMPYHYNLARENEQKKFYLDFIQDLRAEIIEDRFVFEDFTMYDLIVNYNKIFDL